MKKKKKSGSKLAIFLLILLMGLVIYYTFENKDNIKPIIGGNTVKEEKKLKIIDTSSKSRNYAIMINNHAIARKNHAGLDDAYIVYEGIVEGGLTRLMAIYKDKATPRIGSVRSSRHDFLDYAMENDAIYVHFGWSPQAESDIKKFGINNINGLYDNAFTRDYSLGVALEHTAFTSIEDLKNVAEKKGYSLTTTSKPVLDYSVDNIDLSSREDNIIANNVSLPYSSYVETSYTYDEQNKVYLRYVNGEAHMNLNSDKTKTQIEVKNIIVAIMNNYSIDSYGRQEIENVGSGTGYYITNGYAVPITWEKASRKDKTIFKYMDGETIKVNDGNTYIQLFPEGRSVTIGG